MRRSIRTSSSVPSAANTASIDGSSSASLTTKYYDGLLADLKRKESPYVTAGATLLETIATQSTQSHLTKSRVMLY